MSFTEDFKKRNQRLILTLISKQWLVFFIATVLLVYKLIPAEVWAFQASVIIGVNVLQKAKGVSDEKPAANSKE